MLFGLALEFSALLLRREALRALSLEKNLSLV
jgi:hypothetical protein